jgi:hypothetical protein
MKPSAENRIFSHHQKTIPMKSDNRVFLHVLPTMQTFTYRSKKYRTIIPIRQKNVNSCHKVLRREVMDLKTFKTAKLPYFTRVLIFSE